MKNWAKMPCSWQTDPETHRAIRKLPTGQATSALKLYLAICVRANYNQRADLPTTGCARLTLDDLEALTGLSRPMVVAGLRQLRQLDIIEVLEKRPAVYHIKAYESARYWTRLPRAPLYGHPSARHLATLAAMPIRQGVTRHALQLYLYLASIRDRNSDKATVSFAQMQQTLDLSRRAISRGISMLVAHDLIGVRSGSTSAETNERSTSVYWLLGRVESQDAPEADANAGSAGSSFMDLL